ncbi:MBL fold metallo-hydrolase [Prochlorococcus sp. MIT 1300]|uniref:MBL fold metallo-hydrolase n=1 Tax=Prochlorococcus sp. MIT 1300 TaxID=3096218 RepID=UPI002A75347E|nr:MBL fold metallo-hydrolase [Prochlorococcus sp. MIT 1300]
MTQIPARQAAFGERWFLGTFKGVVMSINSFSVMGVGPSQVESGLWAFPPNPNSRGGVSWWLECEPEPLLIDCPEINEFTIHSLKELAAGRKPQIFLTSRDSHPGVSRLQDVLGWPVLVQEQEAYLLPGLKDLESFADEYKTISGVNFLWTPGPTPGTTVAYASHPLNVLFCGRFLIPSSLHSFAPVRNKRTFHWPLYQKSLRKLRDWIPSDACPLLASAVLTRGAKAQRLAPWEAWADPYTKKG